MAKTPATINDVLIRSLSLLDEMIANHDADAIQMADDHYKETKQLIRDIRKLLKLK